MVRLACSSASIVVAALTLVGCADDGRPESGEGWVLLDRFLDVDEDPPDRGKAWATEIIVERGRIPAAAQDWNIALPAAEVDFENQVVVLFGRPVSANCWDTWLVDVTVDEERHVVHGVWETEALDDEPCLPAEHRSAFVVAVDRSVLPEPPFRIQLDAQAPPAHGSDSVTLVQAL